jgi:ribonuclease E
MESRRNNAAVEKRLKDALKNDRARIQLGTISHFGLMEMSRQRLRPSLAETSFLPCPHCAGTGLVRSVENAAIHVLRAIEEEGGKRRSAEICVHAATSIALYLLNNKRDRLADIEQRYGMRVIFAADESLTPPDIRIDRTGPLLPGDAPARIESPAPVTAARDFAPADEVDDVEDEDAADAAPAGAQANGDELRPGETAEEGEQRRRRRRRRRRGGRREDQPAGEAGEQAAEASDADHIEGVPERLDEEPGAEPATAEAATVEHVAAEHVAGEPGAAEHVAAEHVAAESGAPGSGTGEPDAAGEEERRRRRSRRGGRRKRRDDDVLPEVAAPGAEQPELPPVYAGPTPADPFGGGTFDIFDVMDQVEQEAAAPKPRAPQPALQVAPEPQPEPEPEPMRAIPADPAPEAAAESRAAPEPVAEPMRQVAAELEPTPEPQAAEPPAAELAAAELAAARHEGNGAAPHAAEAPAEPEPPPAPVIAPVIIGESVAPAEKKRGWWRR